MDFENSPENILIIASIIFTIILTIIAILMTGYNPGYITLSGEIISISQTNFIINSTLITIGNLSGSQNFVSYRYGDFQGKVGQICTLSLSGYSLVNYTCK